MVGARVVLNDVARRFDWARPSAVVALAGVSLVVEAGEAVCVVGRSGSGKSTLLRLIGAVDEPTSGSVVLDGTNLARLSQIERARLRARLGLVTNPARLLDSVDALENVAVPLVPRLGPRLARAKARESLAGVGLASRAGAHPCELSAGQRQRVAIARALALEPTVLLVDDPTASLDAFTANGVLGLIFASRQSLGTTLVLATHDAAVSTSCDRVLRLHEGRLLPAA